eukprot:3055845-Prymnesium_polylepis.3
MARQGSGFTAALLAMARLRSGEGRGSFVGRLGWYTSSRIRPYLTQGLPLRTGDSYRGGT